MARQERKIEATQHRAKDPDGQLSVVEGRTVLMRTQYADGSWSNWSVEATRYMWNRMPVNLREDGNWETVEASPRLLNRLP